MGFGKGNKRRDKQPRVSPEFDLWLEEVALDRIKNNIDKQLRSRFELTKMMFNAPNFPQFEKDLKTMPTKEDLEKIERGIF